MNRFGITFLAILFSLVACGAVSRDTDEPPPPRPAPPVVQLIMINQATKMPIGSGRGFVTSNSPYILTAAHLTIPGRILSVVSAEELLFLTGYIVFVEKQLDGAVLRVRATGPSEVPLCKPDVLGEDVIIYGKSGPVRARTTIITEGQVRIDYPAEPGDSGSPVVSAERNCVVGAITHRLHRETKDGEKEYYGAIAVHSDVLKWLIAKCDEMWAHVTKEQPDAGTDSVPNDAAQ